ncbi:MAG: hypothetical protein RMK29_04130 [Myxococcales bacterium]|nr:hypothetical protein [Myxococcota bacterium]MDW8280875.1 hypothetical protein [Myxococcales bacterium]
MKRVVPICLVATLVGLPAQAQMTQESVGTAPLLGSDAVRARSEALADALRRAVEQAVAQTAPQARGRIYLVTARAREFVPTYRVLEEGMTGGLFQVRIAAQVDLPRLLREVRAPVAGEPVRTALLLCAEGPEAETLIPPLREALGSRAKWVPCPPSLHPLQQAEDRARADFLARNGAQAALLVAAPVDLGQTAPIRGTQPIQHGAGARAALRFIGPQGGSIDAAAEATAFAPTPQEALVAAARAATERALEQLLPHIGAVLPEPEQQGVQVVLEGWQSYTQYQALVRMLSALPEVASVEIRRFSRRSDGTVAELLLRTATPAEPLGAALGRMPINGSRLQVVTEGPRRLRLVWVPDRALPEPSPEPSNE